ncbi:MAG: hypothetical protein JNK35_05490 [Phycisphaerae bacterium]|nr:hypothetical protein [Phycisphaerae bacterium]
MAPALIAIVLPVLLGCAAPPAPAAAPAARPVGPADLRGPKVAEARATLVDRDANGLIRRLDMPPAEAALPLLGLDPVARARADAILADRARVLDGLIQRHYDLLLELFSAGQSGDTPDAVRLAVVLAGRLAPLRARGPLEDELARVLPEPAAVRLRALVAEYRNAVVAEGAIDNGRVKPGASRFEALASESLRLWGEQIRRSFERQAADGSLFFEQVIRALALRPDQEARVRERLARFAGEVDLNAATPEQTRGLVIDVAAWLDKDQLARLARLMQGRPLPPPKPSAGSTTAAPPVTPRSPSVTSPPPQPPPGP